MSNFLQGIDKALAAAAKNESVKTAAEAQTEQVLAKTANQKLAALAQDAIAVGRLMAHGLLTEMRKEAAAAWNKQSSLEGGHVSGSKITETGSVTEAANALPTSKDNPSKSKIDETSTKHLTEKELVLPTKVQKSESRIKAVSK